MVRSHLWGLLTYCSHLCGFFGKIFTTYGAFTLDVKVVLNENLGGILGGTQ